LDAARRAGKAAPVGDHDRGDGDGAANGVRVLALDRTEDVGEDQERAPAVGDVELPDEPFPVMRRDGDGRSRLR
jgi:hypothetical protein